MNIVMAEPGEHFTGHLRNGGVEGATNAPVFLHDITDATAILANDRVGRAAVGGPIVDHNDFDVAVGLGQRAVDRLRDEVRSVVDGDDDTDLWIQLHAFLYAVCGCERSRRRHAMEASPAAFTRLTDLPDCITPP